ncbi:MAG: cytochrome P450 [Prochlorotrichaceae cyanobacterium]
MKTIPQVNASHLVQILHWALDPVGYQQQNYQRYGGLFEVNFTSSSFQMSESGRVLLLSDPGGLQQVLSQDMGKVFSAPGEVNRIVEPIVGPNSSLLISGEAHRRRRQLITPPFHGERLKVFGQLILDITAEVLAEQPLGQSFSGRHLMQRLTMRVIMEAVFGLHRGDRYQALETALRDRLDLVGSSPFAALFIFFPVLQKDWGAWSPGRRIQNLNQQINTLLYAEISDRRAEGDTERSDVLSLLMAATDENGEYLTDPELRDELMTLLLAGHETTATALTWGLYFLQRHPEVREKLQAELATLPTPWDPMQVIRLPYLEAICNETLRIHPVAMTTFPRRVEVPTTLMGHDLYPGDFILGSMFLIHQREDLYPQPLVFRPERFLEQQFSAYEFIPFGAGVRRCVGSALALYEMKLALASIFQHWDLSLETSKELKPQRRGITLAPNGEVRLRKVARRSPSEKSLQAVA